MKKRTLTLLLTAALGMAAAQTSSIGADARLSKSTVSLEMGRYAGPLSSMLSAIARSAGYDLVFDVNVDALPLIDLSKASAPADPAAAQNKAPVIFAPSSINQKPIPDGLKDKPFNEIWPLLMDIYGLSYDLSKVGGKDLLRVTNSPIQRVFPLKSAIAAEAETRVKLFFGTPIYPKDTNGNITSREVLDVNLDSSTLRIIADPRTNSLIVRGTNRELADVEKVLAEVDKQGAAKDASRKVYSVKGKSEDAVALLSAQYPTLRVTPVGKTGQVVINGATADVEAAVALLTQVDRAAATSTGPVISQRVFKLNSAKAVDLKDTLQGVLSRSTGVSSFGNTDLTGGQSVPATPLPLPTSETGGAIQTVPVPAAAGAQGEAQPAAVQATTPVTLIADPRSNTLIARGTEAQLNQIAELIPVLDVKVPQVNIQVRVQEIRESASRSLGVDWSAGIGNFTTKILGGALTTLFDATKSFAGLNLGATLNALEQQGLLKQVNDANISMFAGQKDPSFIKSGGKLFVNIVAAQATIQREIDYGVTVQVDNVQVDPDGTINFKIGSSVKTPQDVTNVNLLNLVNREAQTTLSLKSGQTALLGGLLSTKVDNSTQGVPFLSSIPIIGQLFKTTKNSTENTQLLLVITANVVK